MSVDPKVCFSDKSVVIYKPMQCIFQKEQVAFHTKNKCCTVLGVLFVDMHSIHSLN